MSGKRHTTDVFRDTRKNPPCVYVEYKYGGWAEIKQRGAGKSGSKRYKRILQRLPRQVADDGCLSELFVLDAEG